MQIVVLGLFDIGTGFVLTDGIPLIVIRPLNGSGLHDGLGVFGKLLGRSGNGFGAFLGLLLALGNVDQTFGLQKRRSTSNCARIIASDLTQSAESLVCKPCEQASTIWSALSLSYSRSLTRAAPKRLCPMTKSMFCAALK